MDDFSSEIKLMLDIARKGINYENFYLEENLLRKIDWMKLLNLSIRQRIFPIVYKFLIKYVPLLFKEEYNQRYYIFFRKINNIIEEAKRISLLAQGNNINFLIFKGVVYSKIIYDDLYLRECVDIDTLINDKDVSKMDRILKERGYFQAYGYDKINKKFKILPYPVFKPAGGHEYFPYYKKIRKNEYIVLELGKYIHEIRGNSPTNFFRNVQEILIDNSFIKTLSISDTLICLVENIYLDSESPWGVLHNEICLKDYLDLYIFFTKYTNFIHWNKLQNISNDYKITHKIFCIFNNLNDIFINLVPEKILKLFEKRFIRYDYYGYGCTEKGSFVNWKSSFVDRLFNNEKKINEFRYLIKQRMRADMNNKTPFILTEFSKVNVRSIKDYIPLVNVKCIKDYISLTNEISFFDLKYLPSYDKNNLYFLFCFNKLSFTNLEKYVISLRFIDSHLNNSIFMRTIHITKIRGKIIFTYFCSERDVASSEILEKALHLNKDKKEISDIINSGERKIIKIKIPFKDLSIATLQPPVKIYYGIMLLKKIYEEIYQPIGDDYQVFLNPEIIEISAL